VEAQRVVGGMSREFDGGYAEYTVVPASCVIPVQTDLDWATLGALPELLQKAHGSLHTGLAIEPGQTLLVRGSTSSVGEAAAVLAKERDLTVFRRQGTHSASTPCGSSAWTTRSLTMATLRRSSGK
jgi:NADPH:quinone reductase-like Zn-dependent oxidoreductase